MDYLAELYADTQSVHKMSLGIIPCEAQFPGTPTWAVVRMIDGSPLSVIPWDTLAGAVLSGWSRSNKKFNLENGIEFAKLVWLALSQESEANPTKISVDHRDWVVSFSANGGFALDLRNAERENNHTFFSDRAMWGYIQGLDRLCCEDLVHEIISKMIKKLEKILNSRITDKNG